MAQYLLSVYQPTGGVAPANLDEIMSEVDLVDAAMHEAGVWVFSGGLGSPADAVVLRPEGDEVHPSAGTMVEADQILGGFTLIDVPDREAALGWGSRLARATTLPIEVRALQG